MPQRVDAKEAFQPSTDAKCQNPTFEKTARLRSSSGFGTAEKLLWPAPSWQIQSAPDSNFRDFLRVWGFRGVGFSSGCRVEGVIKHE